ncbi:MAG: hypothetical protein ACRDNF_13975 [Streptosporangiaceae bacterium]
MCSPTRHRSTPPSTPSPRTWPTSSTAPGAAFYLSQCDPSAEPVIEPSFYWDFGPTSPVTSLGTTATIWSNCQIIKAYPDGTLLATLSPDTTDYPYLPYPPFQLDVTSVDGTSLPELRLDGYIDGEIVTSRSFSADTSGDRLELIVDDTRLVADGSDATRVALRAVDRFGAPRPYPTGDVAVSVQGPAMWLGEVVNVTTASSPTLVSPGQQASVSATLVNGGFPFAANGGVGGVYIRTVAGQPGEITVTVTHPTLGRQTARIAATPPPAVLPGLDPPGGQQVTAERAMTFTAITMSLAVPDGWSAAATSGTGEPGQRQHPGWIFFTSVPITPGKIVQAVTLPTGGTTEGGRIYGMHVFALGVG